MHTTAAGKNPGDRTFELREFSRIRKYSLMDSHHGSREEPWR
jgi:hypothetical protein